jgi:hypothetical protein
MRARSSPAPLAAGPPPGRAAEAARDQVPALGLGNQLDLLRVDGFHGRANSSQNSRLRGSGPRNSSCRHPAVLIVADQRYPVIQRSRGSGARPFWVGGVDHRCLAARRPALPRHPPTRPRPARSPASVVSESVSDGLPTGVGLRRTASRPAIGVAHLQPASALLPSLIEAFRLWSGSGRSPPRQAVTLAFLIATQTQVERRPRCASAPARAPTAPPRRPHTPPLPPQVDTHFPQV